MTSLDLIIDEEGTSSDQWNSIEGLEAIVQQAYTLIAKEFDTRAEVAILLTSDAKVRQLNKDFRGKDKPTNVLSFPDDTQDRLGDIALAFETLAQEAKHADIKFRDHLSHLVVHGMLHLLGYDHQNVSEAEEMEALEVDMLAELNISNPYAGSDPVTFVD